MEKLSYRSSLGIRLKRNLHYFNKNALFEELIKVNKWYDDSDILRELIVDYRIKSIQSAFLKYDRYYPDHQTAKVFNDMLGFRSLCDSYEDILVLKKHHQIRIADMSKGKSKDDGYRGVHAYYQEDNFCYPIEIQYNTYYDRQMNNWLHKYIYKRNYDDDVGLCLRKEYENAKIRNENEFKERLYYVLSNCKEN